MKAKDEIEVVILDTFDIDKVLQHNKHVMGHTGAMAASLVEKWGMVCGMPDGEDSSGKAKLRLMTPEEVIERACKTAELLTAEFHKREWLMATPQYAELQKHRKDRQEQEEKTREELREAKKLAMKS